MKYFRGFTTRDGVWQRLLRLWSIGLVSEGGPICSTIQAEYDAAYAAATDVIDPDEMERAWRLSDIISHISVEPLYSGGWRAEHRDQLKRQYDLTADEADQICELLAEYAEK